MLFSIQSGLNLECFEIAFANLIADVSGENLIPPQKSQKCYAAINLNCLLIVCT